MKTWILSLIPLCFSLISEQNNTQHDKTKRNNANYKMSLLAWQFPDNRHNQSVDQFFHLLLYPLTLQFRSEKNLQKKNVKTYS